MINTTKENRREENITKKAFFQNRRSSKEVWLLSQK
jgi:hypothetical protein